MLNFIIPVRHPSTTKNWAEVVEHLETTVNSILSQDHKNFKVLIAMEESASAPKLSPNVGVVRTNIEPPRLPPRKARDNEARFKLVRADKGARVLAAYRQVALGEFVMVVDHDDFVSNRLARLCAEKPDASGWYVESGYIWSGGEFLLRRDQDFHRECGTSLIVNSHVIEARMRERGLEETMKRWFGSHRYVKDDLQYTSTALAPVPFPGAVYRVGYGDVSRRKPSVFRRLFKKRPPFVNVRQALQIKYLSTSLNDEFGLR